MSSFCHLGLFGDIGFPELLVILVIILLLFGAGRIRGLMRELGGGVSEFKKGLREGDQPEKKDEGPKDQGKIHNN